MNDPWPEIETFSAETLEKSCNDYASLVTFEDNHFCIKDPNGGTYDIPRSDCSNFTKLLWRVHHLCEKTWITGSMITRLIELATEKMGKKMYQGE